MISSNPQKTRVAIIAPQGRSRGIKTVNQLMTSTNRDNKNQCSDITFVTPQRYCEPVKGIIYLPLKEAKLIN